MFNPKKVQSLIKIATITMIVLYILAGLYEFGAVTDLVDGYYFTSSEAVGYWLGYMCALGLVFTFVYSIFAGVYNYLNTKK